MNTKRKTLVSIIVFIISVLFSFSSFAAYKGTSSTNNNDITLQAYGAEYTINYDLQGGEFNGSYPQSYRHGVADVTLSKPKKSGYVFTGWTGSNGSTPELNVTVSKNNIGDVSYTANWRDAVAILGRGTRINQYIKRIAGAPSTVSYTDPDTTITAIERSYLRPDTSGFSNINDLSSSDSDVPIYAWLEGTTIKWYCEVAEVLYGSNCAYMFQDFDALQSFDVTQFSARDVKSMYKFLYGCDSITSINMQNMQLPVMEEMQKFASACTSLQSIKVDGLNAPMCTAMSDFLSGCTSLEDFDATGMNIANVVDLYSFFQDCTSLVSVNLEDLTVPACDNIWGMFYNCSSLKDVKLGTTAKFGSATDFGYLFYNCSALESLDASKIDTKNAIKLNNAFDGCSKIQVLDLSTWNTGKCTTMEKMFNDCYKLNNLNISNFDTSLVLNFNSFLEDCYDLVIFDATVLETGNCKTFERMFRYTGIEQLNLSGFDFSKATSTNRMFSFSSDLSDITFGTINSPLLTDTEYMFNFCTSLVNAHLNNFDWSTLLNAGYMFGSCYKLVDDYTIPKNDATNFTGIFENAAIEDSADVVVRYNSGEREFAKSIVATKGSSGNVHLPDTLISYELGDGSWKDSYTAPSLVQYNDITTLPISDNINGAIGYQFDSWYKESDFSGSSVASITKSDDLTLYAKYTPVNYTITYSLDGGSITNQKDAYTIETETFTLPQPTKSGYEFIGWTGSNGSTPEMSVTIANGSTGNRTYTANWRQLAATFDTGRNVNVKMKQLAGNSSADQYSSNTTITSIKKASSAPGTSITTKIVSTAESETPIYMWFDNGTIYWWSEANTVYLNQDSMAMFESCQALTSLDLSNFDTSSVTEMSRMFYNCQALTSLDLSNFDTSSVTGMVYMFYQCGFPSLNLSNFDTSSVTDMRFMFESCRALTSLDLSSFDTSSVKKMGGMFRNCSGLTTIYVSNKWTTSAVSISYSSEMFEGCTSLIGGNGTVYNQYYTNNKKYAYIDTAEKPGYLTYKAAPATVSLMLDANGGEFDSGSEIMQVSPMQ